MPELLSEEPGIAYLTKESIFEVLVGYSCTVRLLLFIEIFSWVPHKLQSALFVGGVGAVPSFILFLKTSSVVLFGFLYHKA